MSELVIMYDRQVVTSSLRVAENFNKRHDHILRDIEKLKEGVPNFEETFSEATYEHPQNNQQYKMYYMNRDGFTLLAMGFTGKEAMQFKLKYIQAFNEMEQEINKPMSQLEIMQMQIAKMVEQEKQLSQLETRTSAIEQKQSDITEILSLNPTEWRKKVTDIVKRIGTSLGAGSFYQQIWNESYDLLEQRGKCDLNTRRTNKRRRMAENGESKSKRDKVSRLDVIAEDARLTEIYLAIVKELAIKYGINLEVSA